MQKMSARWLKHDSPYELEFEGISDEHLRTRTGAWTTASAPKRYHSPKDLVALGIAGCTGVDVVSILKKMRQPLEELVIDTVISSTDQHPRVFKTCELSYKFVGGFLEKDRVLRAAALSYGKYCGVSAMIKRSGCHFQPRLFLNGIELSDEFRVVLERLDEASQSVPQASSDSVRRAAILVTGNELLAGKTKDTNGAFIIRELSSLGILVSELIVLGDDRGALVETISRLIRENRYIFMTGGLGPTGDDLTSEVVSAAFQLEPEFSQEAWDVCQKAFVRSGRTEIPESNKKQAIIPSGAVVLQNDFGTAAGFAVTKELADSQCTLFALPGVPWECERMFSSEVRRRLRGQESASITWGPWHVWGLGESAMQTLLTVVESDIHTQTPAVSISYQAHAGYISYSLKTPHINGDESPDTSDSTLSTHISRIEEVLGTRILYRGSRSLIEQLLDGYTQLNFKISLAESCTGGKIAAALIEQAGMSAVFAGSVVTYSNDSKVKLLGVSPSTLSHSGAVSVETAEEMARGSQQALASDVALSVTGIAGPTGGMPDKPVGTVCFSVSIDQSKVSREKHAALVDVLQPQGWSRTQREASEHEIVFVCEKRFGDYLSRDLVQKRASVFALCSLVAISETLRG